MLAIRFRYEIDWVGKMRYEKSGMRPKTVGPSRMPPMTSAITLGWLIRPRMAPRPCVMARMMTS